MSSLQQRTPVHEHILVCGGCALIPGALDMQSGALPPVTVSYQQVQPGIPFMGNAMGNNYARLLDLQPVTPDRQEQRLQGHHRSA